MEDSHAGQLIAAGKRLLIAGIAWGKEGSLSVRSGGDSMVITGEGSRLGHLLPDDLVDLQLGSASPDNGEGPSPDAKLHSVIYRHRVDVQGVVRVTPPFSTALGILAFGGVSGEIPVFERLRDVTRVPFYRPGTVGFAGAIAGALEDARIVLTEGFGVVAVGASLEEALDEVESLETSAKILYIYSSLRDSLEG